MQKNSFFVPASSGFFHSNIQCNHLFTPGLWKTLWKLLKTPCPMRFSTFPRFHNALLLCKQTTEFFQIGTKTPFFENFLVPNIGRKARVCPQYLVSIGFWKKSYSQFVNRHLTYISPGGPSRVENRPCGKKRLCFSPILWYTSGKTPGFPACFHKFPQVGKKIPRKSPEKWKCIFMREICRTYILEVVP